LIGVLGGMRPKATANFLMKLVNGDADHIPVEALSHPPIPDRSHAIINGTTSPLPELFIVSSKSLAKACVRKAKKCRLSTSFAFIQEIEHTSKTAQSELVITELSHARCVISIIGEACEALMARLAGVDFSLRVFPVGSFVQTGIHHVGVLIKRDEPKGFEIFVPYTRAASNWDYLCTCALGFGYRVAGDQI